MPRCRGNRLRGIRVSLCCGVFTQGIFMSGYSPQVNNARANTCPHGLPLGACPICNGMGGGGSTKKADEPRRPGEMTYQECYAQWKQMQRAEAMDKAAQEAMLKNAELASKLQKQLAGLSEITTKVLDNIQNALPKPIAKAFEGISNIIIKPCLLSKSPAPRNLSPPRIRSPVGKKKNSTRHLENHYIQHLSLTH